jgi:two-component system nitrogen regulation response regulator NtrX
MIVKNTFTKVLICDDDRNLHLAIKATLGKDFEFKSAFNGDEALLILKKNEVDLVLLDLEMRSPTEGLEYLSRIQEIQSETGVVVYSGRSDLELVKRAMQLGADDYVLKEGGYDELAHVFHRALEHRFLKKKTSQLQQEITLSAHRHELLGNSPAIMRVKKQVERARLSPAPILIQGETGTGKEVVARLLRKTDSSGAFEPFVAIDSSTIQSSVSESILFGYEKGAFTGAEKTTRGLFEEANGGVIYFDELGNMPLEIQNKLLRVLQEKEVLRIGSARPIKLEFRMICATNQNLEKLILEGKFKDDLFQRLNVLQIEIPPLRERTEDIPILLEHFIKIHSNGLEPLQFLPETIEVIRNYPFPGNVRELSNLVLHLYSMCDETIIAPIDLPPRFRSEIRTSSSSAPKKETTASVSESKIDLSRTFYEAVEQFEKAYLSQAYQIMEGNISRMSSDLRMDRSYLHRKLKNYGIHSTG